MDDRIHGIPKRNISVQILDCLQSDDFLIVGRLNKSLFSKAVSVHAQPELKPHSL